MVGLFWGWMWQEESKKIDENCSESCHVITGAQEAAILDKYMKLFTPDMKLEANGRFFRKLQLSKDMHTIVPTKSVIGLNKCAEIPRVIAQTIGLRGWLILWWC